MTKEQFLNIMLVEINSLIKPEKQKSLDNLRFDVDDSVKNDINYVSISPRQSLSGELVNFSFNKEEYLSAT